MACLWFCPCLLASLSQHVLCYSLQPESAPAVYETSVRLSCPLHYEGGEDVAGKLNF